MGISINNATGEISNNGARMVGKQNLSASVDPTITDDSAAGYSVGSIWVNTSTPETLICTDATVGAAVWGFFIHGGGF